MELSGEQQWPTNFDNMKEETTNSTMSETRDGSDRHYNSSSSDRHSASALDMSPTSPGGDSRHSKKKKKKKDKDKEKKKDKKHSSGHSRASSRASRASSHISSQASEFTEGTNEFFSKMMLDDTYGSGFSEEFGEFNHIDPNTEEASGNWSSDGDGSRQSGGTGYVTAGTGGYREHARSGDAPEEAFGFDDDDPFAGVEQFQSDIDRDIDCLSEDDSVASDITGLTGMFSSIDNEEDIEAGESYKSHEMSYSAPAGNSGGKPILSSMHNKAPQEGPPKELRFSCVIIREYERILTLNPSTIQGPSIGLGWKYIGYSAKPIDEYEEVRQNVRKKSSQMILNRREREMLLESIGYSKKDIAYAMRLLTKYRNQRRQTVQNLKAQKVEESMEVARNRVKGLFRGKKK